MKKLIKKIGYLVVFISLFGGCTAFLNSCSSALLDGEPTGNGGVTEIYRHSDFYESKNDLLNSFLIMPRWFNEIDYYPQSYKFTNQMVGFLSFIFLLVVCYIILIKSSQRYNLLLLIISWLYVLYWIIPTIWIICQWINGNTMFSTSTWY